MKILHVLRALEYEDFEEELVFGPLEDLVGQAPFQAPSVFSFFSPAYAPAGFPPGRVAPEFQLFSAPYAVGLANGLLSLLDYGVSRCAAGLGEVPDSRFASCEACGRMQGWKGCCGSR